VRRIEKYLKRFTGSFLGLFLPRERISQIPLHRIQSILVVRQHNELGDMLCAVPLLRALRHRFPGARIDLIASPVNWEIMLRHPFINEVLLYDKTQYLRSPWKAVRFYRRLKAARYDLAIVPSTVSISFTSHLLAYLSGAPYRIGASSLNGMQNPSSRFLNFVLDLHWDEQRNPHQAERNLDYLRCLGITTDNLTAVIGLTEEEKRSAADFLSSHAAGKKYLVGFHPGAGKISNRWPAERFARVADRLASAADALIVVTMGHMDDEPTKKMLDCMKASPVIVKEKDIRKAAAIIDQLSLYITNDTGMMHVAGATATTVLSLFGPSDPYQWAPRSNRSRFLHARDGNIASISEDEVFTAAVELLRGR